MSYGPFAALANVPKEALVSEYILPRNAVEELIQEVPDELRQLLRETWREHDKQSFNSTDDESWPDVPYHYGQGRLREYEVWCDSLTEQDRNLEIFASRVRYETYYDAMAHFLVWVMAKQGLDISAYLRLVRKADRNTALQRFRSWWPCELD
jgi:hypothetical protein